MNSNVKPKSNSIGGELSIFISYSRSDMEFTDKLVTELDDRGFRCLIDRRDMEYGEAWQGVLRDLIAECDTVVFVVSPRSVSSQWCRWELSEISRLSKRLVPVVLEDVPVSALPPEIASIHLLPLGDEEHFDERLDDLESALLTDREWVKNHNRLLGLAMSWDKSERSSDGLLRGAELSDAETWKSRPTKSELLANVIVEAFISESRAAAVRGQKIRTRLVSGVAIGALSLAGIAIWQGAIAVQNAELATTNEKRAVVALKDSQRNVSLFRARTSETLLAKNEATAAALVAMEALPDKSSEDANRRAWPLVPEALDVLDRSLGARISERNLLAHKSRVHRLRFNATGDKLISSGLDGARLWDVGAGRTVANLTGSIGQQAIVWQARFSPDGSKALTVQWDGKVRVWDAGTGKLLREAKNHDFGETRDIVFTKSGKRYITSGGGVVTVWDANKHEVIGRGKDTITNEDNHWGTVVLGITVNEAAGLFATQSLAEELFVYSLESGDRVSVLRGHQGATWLAKFSPDGKWLVTGGKDGNVLFWPVQENRVIEEPKQLSLGKTPVTSLEFGPEGAHILATTEDGVISVISQETQQVTRTIEASGAKQAAWGPYGEKFVTIGWTQNAIVWSFKSGQRIATFSAGDSNIMSAAFTPDGKALATGAENGRITIWPIETEKPGSPANLSPKECRQIIWSTVKAFGSEGPPAAARNIHRVETSDEIKALLPRLAEREPFTQMIKAFKQAAVPGGTFTYYDLVAVHEPSRRVATIAMDGNPEWQKGLTEWTQKAIVWDIDTGELLGTLDGHTSRIHGVVYSHDGSRLLTYGDDKTARVWDAKTYEPISVFRGHEGYVLSGCFGPKGQRAVTGGSDNTVRVWDASTGRQVLLRRIGLNGVWFIGSGEGGDRAIASDLPMSPRTREPRPQKSVAVPLHTNLQKILNTAKQRVGRCLTKIERDRYLLPPRPPAWCVEMKKTPYHTEEWSKWLETSRTQPDAPLPGR